MPRTRSCCGARAGGTRTAVTAAGAPRPGSGRACARAGGDTRLATRLDLHVTNCRCCRCRRRHTCNPPTRRLAAVRRCAVARRRAAHQLATQHDAAGAAGHATPARCHATRAACVAGCNATDAECGGGRCHTLRVATPPTAATATAAATAAGAGGRGGACGRRDAELRAGGVQHGDRGSRRCHGSCCSRSSCRRRNSHPPATGHAGAVGTRRHRVVARRYGCAPGWRQLSRLALAAPSYCSTPSRPPAVAGRRHRGSRRRGAAGVGAARAAT